VSTLNNVIIFSLAGGLLSLVGAVALISSHSLAQKMSLYATPFAAGALLAAAFMDMLPSGVRLGDVDSVMISALLGFLVFFLGESMLRKSHYVKNKSSEKEHANRSLVVIGDVLHNVLDGVVIATAFLVSFPTGVIASVAVAAHEIPQEIGDFGLLLSKGLSRFKVLIINLLTSFATVITAVVVFTVGSEIELPIAILLGLSAGFFIYIAASDVVPTVLKRTHGRGVANHQTFMVILGVAVVAISIQIASEYLLRYETASTAIDVVEVMQDNSAGIEAESNSRIAPGKELKQ
jgi:zinc and cadmium transporter